MGRWKCAAVALGIALALAAGVGMRDLALAQNGPPTATAESPAVITATAAPAEGLTSQSPRVIVSVTGFEPPREGGAQLRGQAVGRKRLSEMCEQFAAQ